MTISEDPIRKYSLDNLDPNLVFTRFGELARKRDELYSDFIEIDEPDEIGNTWVEFSTKVVQDLLSVVDLTKSLFDRLVDELRRSQEDPSQENLSRIKGLTQFWLDLSVMSYLYSTIEKRGVLNQPGKGVYSLGYVNTKKSLDELTMLAFKAGNEFFNLNSRISLGETLSLNLQKKRLDFLEDMDGVNEMRYQILGEYDKGQAEFLMNRVWNELITSSNTWWFLDPIGMHSASEHAISHIKSVKKNWANCTSDLIEKAEVFHSEYYPVAKLSSDVALAQHYRRLAMAALEARETSTASDYFGKAAELTAAMGIENISKLDKFDLWEPSIPEQYLIYTQMHELSAVSSKYGLIIEYLNNSDVEKIKQLIPEILEDISKMLSEGDIAYVSSVAVAYETIFEYISEQLDTGTEPSKIIKFVENRISTVGDRLQKASHQITKNWIKVVEQNEENVTTLNEVVANINYPLMALFILPPDKKIVEPASYELLALKLVTEALNVQTESEKEFGINPVKEMLMRAKTFELTLKAINYVNKIDDIETSESLKNVLTPVAKNAFLRGLIAEIQLRTSVLQYRYVNRIAPLIENSSLTFMEQRETVKTDEDELDSFIQALEELNIATTEVQKYKSPITIGGSQMNWKYISRIDYFASGLVKLIRAVKHGIQAAATSPKAIEDAVTNWDEAKTFTFEAADVIAKADTQDAENLSQQVHSLAKVFYNFENQKRERKQIGQFPVDGVIDLLTSLLMGL